MDISKKKKIRKKTVKKSPKTDKDIENYENQGACPKEDKECGNCTYDDCPEEDA